MNTTDRQLRLPFDRPAKEGRAERVERLLNGQLRGRVRKASDHQFDYQQATALAANQPKLLRNLPRPDQNR